MLTSLCSLARVAQVALISYSIFTVNALSINQPATLTSRATICNGDASLCDKSYGSVAFVGAHNSYAVSTSANLAANQEQDVTRQLNDGIRLLQIQAHKESDGIRLCHTTCLLFNGGFIVDYLTKVKAWIDLNPNEVLTILIVNSDKVPASTFAAAYDQAGLTNVAFAPASAALKNTEWPTLGSMIDSGKTLVTFMDGSADFTTVPFIIDEFSNVWETPFDVTTADFPCTVNRTTGDPTTQMYLINHYLDTVVTVVGTMSIAPDKSQLNVTNAQTGFGSLGVEVLTCGIANGRPPNFLLVDYYNYGLGSVFEVAASINNVSYNPATPIAAPLGNSTVATTAGGSGTTSKPLGGAPARLSMGGAVGWGAAILVSVVGGVMAI